MPAKVKHTSRIKNSGVTSFIGQFLIVAVVFFGIGFIVGQKKLAINAKNSVPQITFTNQAPANQQVDFSLFWRVMETLPQRYIDKSAVNGQKLLYGAISGMVKSLGDPYTAFFDPKSNEAISDELAGKYEGIGIQIGFNKDKRLVVIAPLKGTPAEAAGLRPKDLILKIGNKDTFDMTLPEAVDLIRGQKGTKIKLVLLHDGEEKTYEKEIERAQIDVKSVELEYKQAKKGEVAIIKVSRFGEQTAEEWDNAVADILSKGGVAGVIVDVRNNPGGLLTAAIHLGSEFVRGTIVKQQSGDGTTQSLNADHEGRMLSMPLTVLINGGSASASEIFAGAIRDNKRGKLIGQKSFGKGTVQDVVPFAGGSSLHVTIARWLTPKGDSIHEVGITPDIAIDDKTDLSAPDKQLEKALEQF
ncbi:S41 family peptidase [Candidatus Curtissbacteria bacterium]|nr:S41 family peptidase [Candidatus Curtissbacteria bacterium]